MTRRRFLSDDTRADATEKDTQGENYQTADRVMQGGGYAAGEPPARSRPSSTSFVLEALDKKRIKRLQAHLGLADLSAAQSNIVQMALIALADRFFR